MLTFVWRTDAHVADEAPASRLDDWAETILSKFDQVGRIAAEVGAAAVLDGGDLTHIKSPTRNSHRLVRRIAEVHAKYPCPVYCNVGNHDVRYGDYAHLGDSPLGVLFESGVFRRLYDQHEARFVGPDGTTVRIAGVPYHGVRYDWERLRSITKGDEDYLVVLAHLLASPGGGSMFEGEDILKYGDLVSLDPDVWNFGHWHKDQGIQEIGGKVFVNIGSLSRGALSMDELTRIPGVAILRFSEAGISTEIRRLDVAPAEKVLDLDRKVRQEARSMTVEAFVDSIKPTLQAVSGQSLVATVQALEMPPEVRERVLGYLENSGAR